MTALITTRCQVHERLGRAPLFSLHNKSDLFSNSVHKNILSPAESYTFFFFINKSSSSVDWCLSFHWNVARGILLNTFFMCHTCTLTFVISGIFYFCRCLGIIRSQKMTAPFVTFLLPPQKLGSSIARSKQKKSLLYLFIQCLWRTVDTSSKEGGH